MTAEPKPGDRELNYQEIVARRRSLKIEGYRSLADVGFDMDYVTPYQMASRSATGPVLVAFNWLDAPSVEANRETLERLGYLPNIVFNKVLDIALSKCGLQREDLYVTQAFHLLPATRSQAISAKHVETSFSNVTQHELNGRRVIALGSAAASACRGHDVVHVAVCHPSGRRGTYEERASEIAAAIGSAVR